MGGESVCQSCSKAVKSLVCRDGREGREGEGTGGLLHKQLLTIYLTPFCTTNWLCIGGHGCLVVVLQ